MSASCCPCVVGISQQDCYIACWLLTRYSKLKNFWGNDLHWSFLEWTSVVVLWQMARSRDVCAAPSCPCNVYRWLWTTCNWGLAIVLPCKQMYKQCCYMFLMASCPEHYLNTYRLNNSYMFYWSIWNVKYVMFPFLGEKSHIVAYVYMEQSCDIPTLEVRVVTSYVASGGGFPCVLNNVAQLPLKLVASFVSPVKEADFKVTLNTNQPVVSLSQLFPGEWMNKL